jgi:glucokinase
MLEKIAGECSVRREQIIGIGAGIPAVLAQEADFVIWGPNLAGWRQVDLRGALERHFNLPVCVEYDGHTAVLGEWWVGAGRQYRSIVDIIIGTGVGGGMVLDGRLYRGADRLAGAAGWFVLDPGRESEAVQERALGSWEAHIAGPGLARSALQLLRSGTAGQSSLADKGEQVTAQDVFQAARQGDPLAVQIVSQAADALGRGIANIVSLVNPEIIILGGSVGSHSDFLLPEVRQVVERYAQPISCRSVKIVVSQLGADAGLYGAAYGLILRLETEQNRKGGGDNR